MRYIILAAGVGSRLHPLTQTCPKCLYKLDQDTPILHRMVSLIIRHDPSARISIIIGFEHELIVQELNAITPIDYVYNPFYKITNSIASLWFARHFLTEEVTLLNADVLVEERLVKEHLTHPTSKPLVYLDSSIKKFGDYNVQVNDDKVLVMSKDLAAYYGEYVGITKLDKKSTLLLSSEISKMLSLGFYDQWYENALVQLIFNNNFILHYYDVCDYEWCEIDTVDDLIKAQQIYKNDIKQRKA